jgi:flagellar biosynthesis protein FlhB
MAEGETGEKTEQPTQKKRQDAREKGQVARSNDLSGSAVLLAACCAMLVLGGWMIERVIALCVFTFSHLDTIELSVDGMQAYAFRGGWALAWTLAPLLALIAVTSFAVTTLQVGWHFGSKPFEPDLNRINPIKGMKKVFSLRSLMKLVTGMLKMGAVGAVVALVIHSQVPAIVALIENLSIEGNTARNVAGFIARTTLIMVLFASATLVLVSVLDYAYQRWQHTEDIKMTKQEVKDELKNMEGDPQMRKRRQEAQRKVAQGRMMHDAATADVMVTNPTHFTVAIKYETESSAPSVVAKGADHLALKLREIARDNDIPIVEKPELARALHRYVEVGERIPERYWQAVAEVLAFIWRQDEAMKRRLLSEGGRP